MADFWAAYVSGAVGICAGNPMDVIKVHLQAGQRISMVPGSSRAGHTATKSLLKGMPLRYHPYTFYLILSSSIIGAAAPVLAYGALNSLLFVTYNRTMKLLDPSIADPTKVNHVSLTKIWVAGAVGGLASWIVSAPSELVKCRTQLHKGSNINSWKTFSRVWKSHGLRGLYLAGGVTSARDIIGYGFYFCSYEVCRRLFVSRQTASGLKCTDFDVLVSGGFAGIVTWASIYPLDVIKTRIQAEGWRVGNSQPRSIPKGDTVSMTRKILAREGWTALYRGLMVCSVRAFYVNAIQWYTYEKLMMLFASLDRSKNVDLRSKTISS